MTTGSALFLGLCIVSAVAFLASVAYGISHTNNPR